MKSLAASERHGWARYVAHQAYYSLLGREFEWELMPLALDQGVGTVVWSPLAMGRLGGKIRRGQAAPTVSRLKDATTAQIAPPAPWRVAVACRCCRRTSERDHDDELRRRMAGAVEAGRSTMVVLVGGSSTGKTRACWEALHAAASAENPGEKLLDGWRLWHPFDPTRPDAALDALERVGPGRWSG